MFLDPPKWVSMVVWFSLNRKSGGRGKARHSSHCRQEEVSYREVLDTPSPEVQAAQASESRGCWPPWSGWKGKPKENCGTPLTTNIAPDMGSLEEETNLPGNYPPRGAMLVEGRVARFPNIMAKLG